MYKIWSQYEETIDEKDVLSLIGSDEWNRMSSHLEYKVNSIQDSIGVLGECSSHSNHSEAMRILKRELLSVENRLESIKKKKKKIKYLPERMRLGQVFTREDIIIS